MFVLTGQSKKRDGAGKKGQVERYNPRIPNLTANNKGGKHPREDRIVKKPFIFASMD